jgi:hypothetical protein
MNGNLVAFDLQDEDRREYDKELRKALYEGTLCNKSFCPWLYKKNITKNTTKVCDARFCSQSFDNYIKSKNEQNGVSAEE